MGEAIVTAIKVTFITVMLFIFDFKVGYEIFIAGIDGKKAAIIEILSLYLLCVATILFIILLKVIQQRFLTNLF